jgi:hypothetical protein
MKAKKKAFQFQNPDLEGLNLELPDFDTLTDPSTQIDNRPMSLIFGVKTFALGHRERAAKITTFDARKVKKAVDCIRVLPRPREYFHFVVGQEFAGFDLLPAILELEDAVQVGPVGAEGGASGGFEQLYLTTLGFNRDNIAQLQMLVDNGKITPAKTKILCADFFRRADTALFAEGKIQAEAAGYGWRSFRNHTKLILGEINGKYFVVESSANLRSCHNIEQFVMTQSEQLFNFHATWLETVWQESKD